MNADQNSLETAFSIAICRQLDYKWRSKTLFLTIFFYLCTYIDRIIVFDCTYQVCYRTAKYPVLFHKNARQFALEKTLGQSRKNALQFRYRCKDSDENQLTKLCEGFIFRKRCTKDFILAL